MDSELTRLRLDESLMGPWLALAAADGPDDAHPLCADALPPIGYGWWPDQAGAVDAVEALIKMAATAGILTCPAAVTPALHYCGGAGAGAYRLLVTIAGPDGGQLRIASRRRPWRQIGVPGTSGPEAAGHILAEVVRTANELLDCLAGYAAAAGRPPGAGAHAGRGRDAGDGGRPRPRAVAT